MATDVIYTHIESPHGPILLARNDAGLTHIDFQEGEIRVKPKEDWARDDAPFGEAVGQLQAYFDGQRKSFDLPLAPAGTSFQLEVWRALRDIPYGNTISYGALASRIGRPAASRAVGAANGQNPLAIVVPCHRVVGANGKLTGYAGGIEIKQALLEHEQRLSGIGQGQLPLAEGL